MRKILIILAVPMFAVLILWAASIFCSFRLTFGVVPYFYSIETLRGTLTVERSFDCIKSSSPSLAVDAPEAFDKEFYDTWPRCHSQAESWGIYTCDITYVITTAAKKLDPKILVTPADFIAISYWLLLCVSTSAFIGVASVCYFIRRLRTGTPNKSPEPTAVGACRSAIAVHAASRRWLSFFR
jgi:hypothetical protein